MTPEPDPRFLQANERTYLAWVRTGLALGAAGLGIAGLAPITDPTWVRPVIALTVTGLAVLVLLWAAQRFRSADEAIRRGQQIPPLQNATWLTVGIALVLVLVVVALLVTT